MDRQKIQKLQNQIWTTRISRVNAERRLVKKENFIQFINIYYSCATIIFSILPAANSTSELGFVTTCMSICLLITILYTSTQRYMDHAREYRTNYTKLQWLEMQLNQENITDETVLDIQKEYCELMDSAWNHTPYDYYCTICESKKEYREAIMTRHICFSYHFGKAWRALLMICLVALPIIVYYYFGVR